MAPRAWLIALALLALVSGSALAQLPQQPPCTTITLTPSGSSPLRPGEPTVFVETVSNTGQFEAMVTLAASTETPRATVTPATTQVRIPAGGQVGVPFTVTVAADADPLPTEVVVTVSQTGTCSANGTASPFAVSSTSDSVRLTVLPPPGFEIPGLGRVPHAYLFAGVGIAAVVIGGVVAVAQRPRSPFLVRVPESRKSLLAGRGTSFALEVTNRGSEPDTAHLVLSSVPDGWSAFTALPEVQLAAKESRTLWVMVRAPEAAPLGTTAKVVVQLRSERANRASDGTELLAEVVAAAPGGGSPGSP